MMANAEEIPMAYGAVSEVMGVDGSPDVALRSMADLSSRSSHQLTEYARNRDIQISDDQSLVSPNTPNTTAPAKGRE